MPRRRSILIDYVVYCLVRTLRSFMEILPMDWAAGLTSILSRIAFHVDRRHRRIALDNLRHAFPGCYTEAQLQQLAGGVYEHFGLFILELALMARKLNRRNWQRYLAPNDLPILVEARRSGRPVIVATAHFGNWEMGGHFIALAGERGYLVGRRLANPYIDRGVRQLREQHGHRVLDKNGDLNRMREILAGGGLICTVADQDAGPRGMFVNFFGRPASTHKAIAFLALRYKALIIVAGSYRVGGPLQYAFRIPEIIDPLDYAFVPDATLKITERLTEALEGLIELDLRQYLWLHRRWKHEPPVSPPDRENSLRCDPPAPPRQRKRSLAAIVATR
jgi:KDO2-lipid IV(A) lauroyltransferase